MKKNSDKLSNAIDEVEVEKLENMRKTGEILRKYNERRGLSSNVENAQNGVVPYMDSLILDSFIDKKYELLNKNLPKDEHEAELAELIKTTAEIFVYNGYDEKAKQFLEEQNPNSPKRRSGRKLAKSLLSP